MTQINGMVLVLVAIVVSGLLCLGMWLVWGHKNSKSDAQDENYNRAVLHNILPSNQGVSIDVVMANLKDEDMGGFHLSSQAQKEARLPDEG